MSRLDAAGDLVDESRVPDRSIGKTTNTVSEGGALGAHVFLAREAELAFETGGANVAETDGVANVDVGNGLTLELDAANDLVTDNHSLSHGSVHGIGIADTTADDRHGNLCGQCEKGKWGYKNMRSARVVRHRIYCKMTMHNG